MIRESGRICWLSAGDRVISRDLSAAMFLFKVLLGIAWVIGTVDIDPEPGKVAERPISGFTYTGSYANEILALIPEPGVGLLALLAGGVLAIRRRRAG